MNRAAELELARAVADAVGCRDRPGRQHSLLEGRGTRLQLSRETRMAARDLSQTQPSPSQVVRDRTTAQTRRGEFLENYYCANRPIVITGMIDDWPALAKWSLAYFAQKFSDREVEVQIGRESSGNFEDGDIDIIVYHKDQDPAILRNDSGSGYHWIRLVLRGSLSNRDAVGARVEIVAGTLRSIGS